MPYFDDVVIGGGPNGLVAAWRLAKAGRKVCLLEKNAATGGACKMETTVVNGASVEYTSGGTVLGMMPDFIFRETGLDKRVTLHDPRHPKIVEYDGCEPVLFHRDDRALKRELREKWGEAGDIDGWTRDEAMVVNYLRGEFRAGQTPSLARAEQTLGRRLIEDWFLGSARKLLDRHFTSDKLKIYMALPVTESGPVSIDSPRSAFTMALMLIGSVFNGIGRWGFVKGRLWQIAHALTEIIKEMGVTVVTGAKVLEVEDHPQVGGRRVYFERAAHGESEDSVKTEELVVRCDHVVFATDPLTMARLVPRKYYSWQMRESVERMPALGSSGKLVCLFKRPVRWKRPTGLSDFDTAFRFWIQADSLDEFERRSQRIREGKDDYLPSSIQIYCDGAAMRKMGAQEPFESLTLFIKDMGLTQPGAEMPENMALILTHLSERIENLSDLAWSKLLSPADVRDTYGFHQGNYDGLELCDGQQYEQRTFCSWRAADAEKYGKRFYMIRDNSRLSFCGAAAWPCGSVAGTAGWLCAEEFLRSRTWKSY